MIAVNVPLGSTSPLPGFGMYIMTLTTEKTRSKSPEYIALFASLAAALFLSACGSKEGTGASKQTEILTSIAADTIASKPDSLYPDLDACPDDGPRLPLSRICAGRAVNYLQTSAPEDLPIPDGCHWEVRELPFAVDVMLYHALTCGDRETRLSYSAGAHKATFTYQASALQDDGMIGKTVVEVFSKVPGQDDFRMRTTYTEAEGVDPTFCEVRDAGPQYPLNARIIAARDDLPNVNCGPNAVSDESDHFWLSDENNIYAFSLSKGQWDIDPVSFIPVTPR